MSLESFELNGKEYSVVIPPGQVGNIKPIVHKSQIWLSENLRLPVLTISSDALNGEHRQTHRNIMVGRDINPLKFVIPDGFQVVEFVPLSQSGVQLFR